MFAHYCSYRHLYDNFDFLLYFSICIIIVNDVIHFDSDDYNKGRSDNDNNTDCNLYGDIYYFR